MHVAKDHDLTVTICGNSGIVPYMGIPLTQVRNDDTSASMTVFTRWATMSTVASEASRRSAVRSFASVLKSSAENVSSNTQISGRRARACAST